MSRLGDGLLGGLIGAADHVVRNAEREQAEAAAQAKETRAEARDQRAEQRALDRNQVIAQFNEQLRLKGLNAPEVVAAEQRKSKQARADYLFKENNQRFAPRSDNPMAVTEQYVKRAAKGDEIAKQVLNLHGKQEPLAKDAQLLVKPVKMPHPRGAALGDVSGYAVFDARGSMVSAPFASFDEAQSASLRIQSEQKQTVAKGTVSEFIVSDYMRNGINPLFHRN